MRKLKHAGRQMLLDRDAPIRMRDGVTLRANIFRPPGDGPFPVILSATLYGKDITPDTKAMFFMRVFGIRFGRLRYSRWTGFEAPDPLHWTARGYAVAIYDLRGMHKSEGACEILTDRDAEDYAEVIAWMADQPWSSGKVGLLGVSFLAMTQWRVAALRPRGLAAIAPWEGVTDPYRELAFHGGIPETAFNAIWFKRRILTGRHKGSPPPEAYLTLREQHPCDDAYWAAKRAQLENIDVPALVCVNWSDQCLHTRGSLEGFRRIGSASKWLYTHGRRKWEVFYGEEATKVQEAFFDCFLKGVDNGFLRAPPVRLEVRAGGELYSVRYESRWPPAGEQVTLFLSSARQMLCEMPPPEPGSTSYDARGKSKASFAYRFDTDTEITGPMRLHLWISADTADDADVFATVHKLDAGGREVVFPGFSGMTRDCVARGWLRASHRRLDEHRSTPIQPIHTHDAPESLPARQPAAIDIEIIAACTLFEAGTSMRIDVQARDPLRYPAVGHAQTVNHGRYHIHAGGQYDSRVTFLVTGRSPQSEQ
jgi:predicted acyl esterase